MRERWLALVSRISATAPADVAQAVYDDLLARYTAGDRHYHNLAHIQACLRLLDGTRSLAEAPDTVELAIWFHDAIYDSHRADNEELSARLAADALARMNAAALAPCVSDLILATRHNAPPTTADAALLVDIDLSILGQPAADFDAYERAIRAEYAWVPELVFRGGRSRVLESFLQRPRLFTTDHFHHALEVMARQNLACSLARLAT